LVILLGIFGNGAASCCCVASVSSSVLSSSSSTSPTQRHTHILQELGVDHGLEASLASHTSTSILPLHPPRPYYLWRPVQCHLILAKRSVGTLRFDKIVILLMWHDITALNIIYCVPLWKKCSIIYIWTSAVESVLVWSVDDFFRFSFRIAPILHHPLPFTLTPFLMQSKVMRAVTRRLLFASIMANIATIRFVGLLATLDVMMHLQNPLSPPVSTSIRW
jgi:hypothetical protein